VIQSLKENLVGHVQQEDLIWDNLHVLKSDCLHTGTWETLKNPSLIVSLAFFDMVLHQIDYDFIFDVGVVLAGFVDLLTVFRPLVDFSEQQI
jgi:hypothetical protein